jgi:hypothetical protein
MNIQNLIITLLIIGMQAWSLSTQEAKVYSAKDQKLLYTIKMKSTDDFNTSFVYLDPQGKKLGMKIFKYAPGCETAPNVLVINLAYPQKSEVVVEGNQVKVKNEVQGKQSKETWGSACQMAWDAGIHRLILQKWESLLKKPLKFKLLAFADEKSLSFTATMDSNFKVHLEPDNGLVKMFVGEIWFQYDKDRKLLKYRGASDMKNSEGKSPEVLVVYGPKITQ